ELVDVADFFETPAIFSQHLLQRVGKIFGEQILDAFPNCRIATEIEDVFERRVESCNSPVEIDREQANVNRFDNRLVEFLQQLQLRRALLLILVEQTVFNRDCDVARNRAQNLDVLGRKQPTIN